MEETEAHQMNCKTKSPGGGSSSTSTSTNFSAHKPGFHPRTPSSGSTSTASLPSFMSASVMTPPAKRFHFYATQHQQSQTQQQKVRNPFEAALAERLHLPTIASPSLFQRPTTPQLSSTQFEWTIDDVSSLKPVHVEPHETQFQDSPDPDYEAKAQSAISSFFKEHQIVPSPVNCPLRQQRILLAEINGNTPIAKPGRRIRDFGTQTELTLPSQLPPELEEALRPYFQPQLALGYDEDGHPSYSKQESNWLSFNSSSGGSGSTGHNVSMRRKLFDIHNIIVLDEQRKVQTPTTPKLLSVSQQQQRRCVAIVGKLSDSFERSSPGLMSRSPSAELESVSEYYSPNVTTSQRLKQHIDDDELDGLENQPKRRSFLFRSPNAAELSPILPSPKPAASSNRSRQRRKCLDASHTKSFETPAKFSQRSAAMTRRRLNANPNDEDDDDANIEIDSSKFTPDRSSSPLHSFYASAAGSGGRHSLGGDVVTEMAATFATESFHSRFISRLVVTSANKSQHNKSATSAQNLLDTTEIIENDDDEAMLVSQLSMHNSNLSSSSINSHCDTPTGKKRSASRKNLSQSFTTANWADEAASSSDDENGEMNKTNLFDEVGQRCKKTLLINDIDKKILPLLVQNNAVDTTNESSNSGDGKQLLLLSQPTDNANSVELSQQASGRGNFYRTDSGFNEMTSSSTSTALLLLSQQDESSRDAFVLRSSGEVSNKDEMDVSMMSTTRSSTPTKQQQTLSGGIQGTLNSAQATQSKAAFNDLF